MTDDEKLDKAAAIKNVLFGTLRKQFTRDPPPEEDQQIATTAALSLFVGLCHIFGVSKADAISAVEQNWPYAN